MKTKTPWGEQPYVAPSIKSFFHTKSQGTCKSLPLSVAFLQEILDCLPETSQQPKHYTEDIRTELGQRYSLDTVGYVAVKVTEFVLLQKDIGLLIKGEMDSVKPDVKQIRHLRDVAFKLSDIRNKAAYSQGMHRDMVPRYTNDL